MLMERKLTIRETLCVRWLFSLITMLLVSVGMQAEDYGLTVAGVQVTDANASNITGENITAGTVSFSNGTLTLNEATINGSIVSDNTLTVHLIGRNVIHNTSAAFQIAGSYDLSFTAVRGATLLTDATTDADFAYSVGSKSAIELGYYDLPYGEDYSYKLSYDAALKRCLGEYYGIDIYAFTNDASSLGPQNITAANCDKLAGYYNEDNNTWNNSIVTLSYDKSSNTLTMNNMNLESAMDCYLFRITEEQAKNVTIYLQGNNKLRQFNGEYGMGLITIDGSIDKAITITTDANNPGSLSMEDLPYEESTVIGATATYQNGLAYSKDGSTHYIEVPATSYGITIAGVGVTNRNAANVLADDEVNDGKVSFDATTNTLTLNGAKIDRSNAPVESCAITYVGSEDLTIEVYGTGNELIGAGGCEAIRYDGYGSSNPRLIFAKGNSQTCELYLKGNGVVSGFDDVDFGGLNLLSENDPGIHWDDDSNSLCLKSYDGNRAGEVTLTSAEVYPLWVWCNNHDQSHIQVTAANRANIMGENNNTVTFDGDHTLTLNNAAFTELNEQSAIVVGPSMTALSVNLVGASTIDGTDHTGFYFAAPSILTFTTNESTPGSLTMIHGSIVDSGNNITLNYKNGLGRLISQQDIITTDWVRSLYIDGISDAITGDYTSQDESVKYVAATHTLTLTNAAITGGVSSNIDHLTINLVGTNSIGYIGSGGDADTSVEFTGNGTLTFSWQDGVMLGFSSVDFGEYNLLSNSTPGIHWDEMTKALKTYDNNAYAAELTLTKEEVYPIWVYDAGSNYHYRQITAENKTNVLGDDLSEEGSEPTVRFDDSNNTLTLNWAQIDMSNSTGQSAVESSIDNLKVKLLGYNTVTIAENSDWPSYVFRYIGKSGNAQLTFETEASQDGSYGSISASGIQVLEDLARNYTIANQLLDANVNPKPEQTGWHHVEETGYYKSVKVSYVEYYDLWMGGGHINSGNLMPVSGGTAYNPATHTLHLSGYGYSDVISSKMPELIVEVEGSNNLSGFSYTGTGNGRIVFRAAENSWSANSVTMSNDDGVIVGFNEVVIDEPLRVATPATAPTTWTADIKNAVISDDLYLEVAGTKVTANNKSNVLGDGKVSFDTETNTLTLNGATINGGIRSSLDGTLTVHLVGENVIDGGYVDTDNNGERAFVGELQTTKLEITTDAENPGQLLLKRPYVNQYNNAEYYSNYMYPSFKNGLVESKNNSDKKVLIAQGPVVTPGEGLYWTDQQYTIPEGTQITCSDSQGHAVNVNVTENSFTLTTTGKYTISISKAVTVDESNFSLSNSGLYIVHNKPGFSKEAGSYTGAQTITLTNLPEDLLEGAEDYPQVWYYLGEDDDKAVRVYSAEQEIAVSESTKVCVYFLDEDSGKVLKSANVEAEYTIRQDPALRFYTSENSYMSTGSTENISYGEEYTSPVLKGKIGNEYTNELTDLGITYSSSDETVATIDQTGKITIVGGGYVTITATSQQTDVYAASSTNFILKIRPADPNVSLEEGAYYTGQSLTMLRVGENGTMYYSYGDKNESQRTVYPEGGISLPKGCYDFYPYTRCGTDEQNIWSYGNAHRMMYVYDQPTISKDAGTYDGEIEVEITNLPESGYYSASVYYYFDDDEEHAVQYTSGSKITINESKTLNVYIYVEGDSGKTHKTEIIERQYVIRQNAGLAYTQNNESVEVAEYTIGGSNNAALPTLQNENKLTVTYTSSKETVATVNGEGVVTPVGVGETTITAASAQTETLQAGEASYTLKVYKDLNHESITVSVANVTYTGSEVEPDVTVKDGTTDVTEYFTFSYSDNVQVGTNAKVTIVPNNDLEVNFYVGSRTETFAIDNRTLEVGKDVNFASGQKWASFYTTTENLELPDGVMAYIVTGVANSAVSVKAINYVPKNVPVLIENESTTTTDNASAEGNLLQGTTESTAVSGIEGNVYVLYSGGFTRATSGAIPARRAYLVLEQNAGARLSIFEDDATGIGFVANSLKGNDQYYDLQGRKVESHAKKGLYIKNGRKVVVK